MDDNVYFTLMMISSKFSKRKKKRIKRKENLHIKTVTIFQMNRRMDDETAHIWLYLHAMKSWLMIHRSNQAFLSACRLIVRCCVISRNKTGGEKLNYSLISFDEKLPNEKHSQLTYILHKMTMLSRKLCTLHR